MRRLELTHGDTFGRQCRYVDPSTNRVTVSNTCWTRFRLVISTYHRWR